MEDRDFDVWHDLKKEIEGQAAEPTIYFREGEIWWCRLGVNIGHEEDGKGDSYSRPVLILRKFNKYIFWALPLSTKLKENPYYVACQSEDGETRAAMISQLRLISSKRLTDKISTVTAESLGTIKKAVKDLL